MELCQPYDLDAYELSKFTEKQLNKFEKHYEVNHDFTNAFKHSNEDDEEGGPMQMHD